MSRSAITDSHAVKLCRPVTTTINTQGNHNCYLQEFSFTCFLFLVVGSSHKRDSQHENKEFVRARKLFAPGGHLQMLLQKAENDTLCDRPWVKRCTLRASMCVTHVWVERAGAWPQSPPLTYSVLHASGEKLYIPVWKDTHTRWQQHLVCVRKQRLHQAHKVWLCVSDDCRAEKNMPQTDVSWVWSLHHQRDVSHKPEAWKKVPSDSAMEQLDPTERTVFSGLSQRKEEMQSDLFPASTANPKK